jgi:hypothetical protein
VNKIWLLHSQNCLSPHFPWTKHVQDKIVIYLKNLGDLFKHYHQQQPLLFADFSRYFIWICMMHMLKVGKEIITAEHQVSGNIVWQDIGGSGFALYKYCWNLVGLSPENNILLPSGIRHFAPSVFLLTQYDIWKIASHS